jgi:hypothetical protein
MIKVKHKGMKSKGRTGNVLNSRRREDISVCKTHATLKANEVMHGMTVVPVCNLLTLL